jgi:uncharacterized membrane protein
MISVIVLIIQFLSISLWIGGSFVLLALVAPIVFQTLPLRSDAGDLMVKILRAFNVSLTLSLVILFFSLSGQIVFLGSSIQGKLRFVLSMVVLALGINVFLRASLFSRIEQVRLSLRGKLAESDRQSYQERFRRLHGQSMALFVFTSFLGVTVAIALLLP